MNKPQMVEAAGLTVNSHIEGSIPPPLSIGGPNVDLAINALVIKPELPTHFMCCRLCPARGDNF